MTLDELQTAIEQEVALANGDQSKLSEQRADAMKRYLGEPYGNERPDRSTIVTRDVMDTVEWIKPEMMKLFSSGGDTVRFEPQGPNDIQQAQQETDYVNYVFHRKNPGFKILYEWVNDALLQKNGIVKGYYDESKPKTREEYEGLSENELRSLAIRDEIEILETTPYPDPVAKEQVQSQMAQIAQMAQSDPMAAQFESQKILSTPIPQIYNVTVLRSGAPRGLTIENIPPEEFLISKKAKDIQSSPFCAHRRTVTKSDLREMGYTEEQLENIGSLDHSEQYSEERIARHSYDETEYWDLHSSPDESMQEYWATEAYIRVDFNGDGVAELRRVFKVGSTILDNEEVDCMPFAGWTPIIMSHKFHGLSMADLVSDLQRLKTQLLRNVVDNQYLTNNGRYEAVESMVNLDDLTTSRPHGVVRVKSPGMVKALETPQLGATAFQMLGYVDQLRERRTGVSERTQGLDPNQLGANQAATAVNQVMTAAQQRIELIARVFAETGLTDLFRLIHKLVIQHHTSPEIFRLRDQYIEVNPSTWKDRTDTSVVVGLGNGSREQEMLQLNMIFQNQLALSNHPGMAGLVNAGNMYNTLEDQVKVFNKAASGRYFTDPSSQQAQQAQMAQQQQAQAIQQLQQQMAERAQAVQELEAQIKQFTATSNDQNKKAELDIKREELAQEDSHHEDQLELDTAEMVVEASLEREQNRGVEIG